MTRESTSAQAQGDSTLKIGAVAALAGAVVAAVFILYPCRNYSWDVLERGHALWTWDRAPASIRYFFAHVLELPFAWPFHRLFATDHHLFAGQQIMESLAAGLIVFLIALTAASAAGRSLFGPLASLPLATALYFWIFSARGEERTVGALFLLASLVSYVVVSRSETFHPGRVLLVSVLWALAPLVHLTNLILFPYLALDAALAAAGLYGNRGPALRNTLWVGAAAGSMLLPALFAAYVAAHPSEPVTLAGVSAYFLKYHDETMGRLSRPTGGASWHDIATGMGPTVSAHSALGLGVFLIGLTLATASAVALVLRGGARRRPAFAFLIVGTGWCLYFSHYEPWNPEDWLPLWAGVVLFLGWSVASLGLVRRTRGWIVAGSVCAGAGALLYASNANAYRMEREEFGRGEAARALDSTLPPGYVLLAGDGMMARVYRAYCPHRAKALPLNNVMRGEPEKCCPDDFLSVADVNRKLAAGTPVLADEPAADALRAAGVRLHELARFDHVVRLTHPLVFFQLDSPLPASAR